MSWPIEYEVALSLGIGDGALALAPCTREDTARTSDDRNKHADASIDARLTCSWCSAYRADRAKMRSHEG